MMFNWKMMFVGLLFVLLIVFGWLVNYYCDNVIFYKEQCDNKVSELEKVNVIIIDMQQCQFDVDVFDVKYMKELVDEKVENDVFWCKFDNGGWVFVKGKCFVLFLVEIFSVFGMGNDVIVEFFLVVG